MRDAAPALLTALGVFAAFTVSCAQPPPQAETFVAFDRDFQDFRSWERFDLGSTPLTGHPMGPRFAYVNRRPMQGETEFPTGTIIVKVVENGTPDQWEIFAMVKRGGTYNAMGALGWEWFILRIGLDDRTYALDRGLAPSFDDGGGYGAIAGSGGCNACHNAVANDYVISPLLTPAALAR